MKMSLSNLPESFDSDSFRLESNCFPDELKNYDQWVAAKTSGEEKQPILPWTASGQTNWNNPANQTDFNTAKAAVEGYENREIGFVFAADDPFVFVDFDDARDPATGHVDPAVADLIERAESYADVSTSGTGLHVIVRGRLPDETKKVDGAIGDNEASIEIYDNNRLGVMTGQHLVSTPQQCHEQQALITEVAGQYRSRSQSTPDEALEEPTHSREEVEQIRKTTDLDTIWDAIKQTRPADIWLKSETTEERSDGTKSLDPSWEHSESGTRIGEFDDGFVYRKGMIGFDVLQMVALEEGIIDDPRTYPSGESYFEAVAALRNRGAPIPEYREPDDREFKLPAEEELLDHSLADLRERAREDGLGWPSTDELRERLKARFHRQLRQASNTIIEAPTSSGKTHLSATTAWSDKPDATGGAPVIHLSKTREARNSAYEMSEEARLHTVCLRAGDEACPVGAGRYDHDNNCGHESLGNLVNGDQTVSEWLRKQTDKKSIPFARAHRELEQRYRNRYEEPLPCCRETRCPSQSQWDEILTGDDTEEQEAYDVIHATHQFAHISGLIDGANVVFDEQPEFTLDAESERLEAAIESFLSAVNAPRRNWADFFDCAIDGSGIAYRKLQRAVDEEPPDSWYFDNSDAHLYAPALARALVHADAVGNMRYASTMRYQPFFRGNGESSNGTERVMVVVNERREFELVKIVPALDDTRCVIGFDAHPTPERWELDTLPSMSVESILSDDQRHNWRRFERGLWVVQVGNADRPLTSERNLSESKMKALIDELAERHSELRTAITSKAVEGHVERLLPGSDVGDPVLHYGEELSRNDFAGERVGLLAGCIDPGDESVLNWLALRDGDATPTRSDEACTECEGTGCYGADGNDCCECLGTGNRRERGRGFDGPDAAVAEALLGSVRETHVAQGVGRYARKPKQADELTVVFVWTAAVPDELVDVRIPDARSLTETQQQVVEYVREEPDPVPTRDIAEALPIEQETARQTLATLAENGPVTVRENAGKHAAHLYDIDRRVHGVLQLGGENSD